MPRINIEPQFWDEIGDVAAKVGDYDKAIGQALRLFKFAQQRFKEGKVIRQAEFDEKFHPGLIPTFARRGEEGIMIIVGDVKHFGWLRKRVLAGSKGGSASKPKNNNLGPKQTEASESKPKHTEPSYSSSYSGSSSPSSSKESATALPETLVPIYQTAAELKASFPIMMQEQIKQKYPDSAWADAEIEDCHTFHGADPVQTPRTPGAWHKKVHTWLKTAWNDPKRKAGKKPDLSDLPWDKEEK